MKKVLFAFFCLVAFCLAANSQEDYDEFQRQQDHKKELNAYIAATGAAWATYLDQPYTNVGYNAFTRGEWLMIRAAPALREQMFDEFVALHGDGHEQIKHLDGVENIIEAHPLSCAILGSPNYKDWLADLPPFMQKLSDSALGVITLLDVYEIWDVVVNNAESFFVNQQKLTDQGLSDESALAELVRRAHLNIEKKILEDELANLPPAARSYAKNNPGAFRGLKRSLRESYGFIPDHILWKLGLTRNQDGTLARPPRAENSYLEEELAIVNGWVNLQREIKRIGYIMVWLSKHCPPSDMPIENRKYNNPTFLMPVRSLMAKQERERLEQHARYYIEQVREKELYRRQWLELMNRLDELESQLYNRRY